MQRCDFRPKPKSKTRRPVWSASGTVPAEGTQGVERKAGSRTVIALHVRDPGLRVRKSEATEAFAFPVQHRPQVNGPFAVHGGDGLPNEEIAVKNCNDR